MSRVGGVDVSVATDGCIYLYEVFATSTPTVDRKAGATKGKGGERVWVWGGRAVLVLVGIRLVSQRQPPDDFNLRASGYRLDWVWTGFIMILLRCVSIR
jgi:hypothetical protein